MNPNTNHSTTTTLDRVTARLATLTADVRKVMTDLAKAAPTDPWATDDPIADRLLTAVDTAVIDLADALDDDSDPDDLPGHPVRSVVLDPADAVTLRDFLEMPEEGHGVQWAHRDDWLVDVRLTPADYTNLQDADAETGPYLAEDGRLVVEGRRYEVTVGWPRRADGQVDAVRGYGAEHQD